MATVYTHMTMSLDGYIADPKDGIGELFGWYSAGDVIVPGAGERWSFRVDANSAEMLREMLAGAGALVSGRRLFDLTNGWDDHHPIGAPVVVVTHNAPRDITPWPRTTFVNGVAEGIAAAREIAGGKDVTIASADIARQALDLGLVDEVLHQPGTGAARPGRPVLRQPDRRPAPLRRPGHNPGPARDPPAVPRAAHRRPHRALISWAAVGRQAASGAGGSAPGAGQEPPPEAPRPHHRHPVTSRTPRDGTMNAQPLSAREQALAVAVAVAMPAVGARPRHHSSEAMRSRALRPRRSRGSAAPRLRVLG